MRPWIGATPLVPGPTAIGLDFATAKHLNWLPQGQQEEIGTRASKVFLLGAAISTVIGIAAGALLWKKHRVIGGLAGGAGTFLIGGRISKSYAEAEATRTIEKYYSAMTAAQKAEAAKVK